MKLTIKTDRYALNASCGCTKGGTNACGITYRTGQ